MCNRLGKFTCGTEQVSPACFGILELDMVLVSESFVSVKTVCFLRPTLLILKRLREPFREVLFDTVKWIL